MVKARGKGNHKTALISLNLLPVFPNKSWPFFLVIKVYNPKSIILQGMGDFLFAINLSSLVGVRLDVI